MSAEYSADHIVPFPVRLPVGVPAIEAAAGGHTAGMTPPPADPPAPTPRYGREPMPTATGRLAAIGLGALVVLAALAVAMLGYQRFVGVDVQGEAATFKLLDDRTTTITISVTRKDPAVPAVCIVRARSRDGAEIGRREVFVGPSEAKTVQVTTTVTSYQRPAVADIYGCGIDVPDYLLTS